MKMLTLCLIVILITTFTTLLLSENAPELQLQGMNMTMNVLSTGKIFYQDPDNNILLIDFKEVNHKLLKVKVMQKHQLLMEDKVSDLAEDSIYEVDLNNYGKGKFTVTLITVDEEEITEEINIQ